MKRKMKCPMCGKRAFDIEPLPREQVEVELKCPNSSTTKIANNLTLSLIDVDFTFSLDEGTTWVTGATITSLAPQGVSNSILIKNTIPPPTQMLGPRAPRFEVTIGSWS